MKYFVLGLGLTGISTIKTLSKMGNTVYGYDENIKEFTTIDKELENYNYRLIEDIESFELSTVNTVVKSPGIPLTNKLVRKFIENGIEVVSDLELAYRLFPEKNLVSITGTNGKTTTTMLLTHIINTAGNKALAIGNIGVGMLWEIYNNNDIDFFIIECSSFQLASVKSFRTKVAGFINISIDHLDWHGSLKQYTKDKSNIFRNQTEKDFLVINSDDKKLSDITQNAKSRIFETSMKRELEQGVFLKEREIIYKKENNIPLLNVEDFKIVGMHNIQNALIAIGMAIKLEIEIKYIIEGCKTFSAVEHRIEFVKEVNGVKYYNDSKGTNIDATVKAINSFVDPIILIAGGYDKKIAFDDLFSDVPNNLKSLILFGETGNIMKEAAIKYGIKDIYIVKDMESALKTSKVLSKTGDIVLLSPANASWGMYKSYVERGNHFKEIVKTMN